MHPGARSSGSSGTCRQLAAPGGLVLAMPMHSVCNLYLFDLIDSAPVATERATKQPLLVAVLAQQSEP